MDADAAVAGFPRRLLRRLVDAGRGFSEHNGMSMAAAVAYYFALSLFPLLMVLVAGLGVALKTTTAGQDAQHRLLAALETQISPELSDQVAKALATVSENAGSRGPLGFVALVITSIAIFTQVDYAFSLIWTLPNEPKQGWLGVLGRLAFRRLKALLMLLGAGAFVLAATIASLVWSGVQAVIEPAVPVNQDIGWIINLSINMLLNFLAFAVIYRYVPRTKIRWGDALRGAVVAAVLWEIGRQVLTVYLVHRGYASAYGVIGSFLAIMLWAYYGTLVLFFGAEFTRAVSDELRSAGKQASS
jgi:membrane protein